jgi:hypothetical protein
VGSQGEHVRPFVPHVAAAGSTHAAPTQQPFGQDIAPHAQIPAAQ